MVKYCAISSVCTKVDNLSTVVRFAVVDAVMLANIGYPKYVFELDHWFWVPRQPGKQIRWQMGRQ